MPHTFNIDRGLFEAFLERYPLGKKIEEFFLKRILFQRLVDSYEAHWRDYCLPRLLKWKKSHLSKLDPARFRGDELQLFRPHHEVDYSNWMSWLLSESNRDAEVLQRAVLVAMCPDLKEKDLPLFKIKREVGVMEGYEEQSGSLDLLLLDPGEEMLLVIENKTRNPEAGELEKHEGYRKSIVDEYPNVAVKRFLFLLPNKDDIQPEINKKHGNFELAEWSQVARALRSLLMRQEFLNDVKNEVYVGLFISAIEGYILGYPLGAWRHILLADNQCPLPQLV